MAKYGKCSGASERQRDQYNLNLRHKGKEGLTDCLGEIYGGVSIPVGGEKYSIEIKGPGYSLKISFDGGLGLADKLPRDYKNGLLRDAKEDSVSPYWNCSNRKDLKLEMAVSDFISPFGEPQKNFGVCQICGAPTPKDIRQCAVCASRSVNY